MLHCVKPMDKAVGDKSHLTSAFSLDLKMGEERVNIYEM